VNLLGLFGGRGFPRPDGPDGFVGNDDAGNVGGRQPFEAFRHVAFHHREGFAGFALGQGFPHAENRGEGLLQRQTDFLVDERVRLAEKLASFRVAQDDVGRPGVFDHAGGHFAGEGALEVVIHVLAANLHARALRGLGGGGEGGEGRADQNFAVGRRAGQGSQFFHKVNGLGDGFVHFPIAGHKRFA